MSVGATFDGAVFSTKRSQFFAKYHIQRLFWRFSEGVSLPFVAVKKGEAKAGTLYASRCDVL